MYGGIINVIKTCFQLIVVVAVSGAVHLRCSSFAYSFCTASMVTLAVNLRAALNTGRKSFASIAKTISNRESAIKRHVPHWKQNGNGQWGYAPGSIRIGLVLLGIGAHKQHWRLLVRNERDSDIFCSCFFHTQIYVCPLSYLPSLASSSRSDGERLVRRHKAAISPMCSVRQHTKSMISNKSRTPPTATAMIDAELNT